MALEAPAWKCSDRKNARYIRRTEGFCGSETDRRICFKFYPRTDKPREARAPCKANGIGGDVANILCSFRRRMVWQKIHLPGIRCSPHLSPSLLSAKRLSKSIFILSVFPDSKCIENEIAPTVAALSSRSSVSTRTSRLPPGCSSVILM